METTHFDPPTGHLWQPMPAKEEVKSEPSKAKVVLVLAKPIPKKRPNTKEEKCEEPPQAKPIYVKPSPKKRPMVKEEKLEEPKAKMHKGHKALKIEMKEADGDDEPKAKMHKGNKALKIEMKAEDGHDDVPKARTVLTWDRYM